MIRGKTPIFSFCQDYFKVSWTQILISAVEEGRIFIVPAAECWYLIPGLPFPRKLLQGNEKKERKKKIWGKFDDKIEPSLINSLRKVGRVLQKTWHTLKLGAILPNPVLILNVSYGSILIP